MKDFYNIGQYPRWTILIHKDGLKNIDKELFKVVNQKENLFTDEYLVVEIEAQYYDCDIGVEEIMIQTEAIAVHEEYTNAIVITPDGVEEIGDSIYTWNGSGTSLMADLLTEMERLDFLAEYLQGKYNKPVRLEDIKIQADKDSPLLPLKDNIDKLFLDDIKDLTFGEADEKSIWWPLIVKDKGLFVIVVDEDNELELLPEKSSASKEIEDHCRSIWEDWDDDWYDYPENHLRRT